MQDPVEDAQPPVAFLSHASEDKARFAEPLARELAKLGIRPWLDKWEIFPGDSLVQRLFDEGLARADAVILIASEHSVSKPWVREELDSATVQRINRGTRLIPVRLDAAEMPAPLKHLVWIDAERSDERVRMTARKIADTMYGLSARPAVGRPPGYSTASVLIPGLTPADSFLLAEIVRETLDQVHLLVLGWNNVKGRAESEGLAGEALVESLHALAEGDYVDAAFRGEEVHELKLTRFGYLTGIEAVIPEVKDVHRRIIAALVNDPPVGRQAIEELAQQVGTPHLVVAQLLQELEDGNLLNLSRTLGGTQVNRTSPTLRRLLN
ncbi:toll/interleukin-1 receptor domain-containing protein [Nonomuraea sp. NPDC004297]